MLVNWFFDCFPPSRRERGSTVYTTAPTASQVEDLLWADVKSMRPKELPGRVLPGTPRMVKGENWWAVGRTTSDSGGKGSARFQGKHPEFGLFILDEAEGVADFVFKAVWAMMTGCRVVIVLMLGNPQTRTSRFHKVGQEPGVANYRLSVLDHPNVLDGRETVPGATRREWVVKCVQKWCEVVDQGSEDDHTFTLPFDVPAPAQGTGSSGPAGTIFRPNAEFLFRVMGIAPANISDDTFVPVGRFEAACKRERQEDHPAIARMGMDCAGYGTDLGTLYIRHNGAVWRAAQFAQQDPTDYWFVTRRAALALADEGVKSLHIRIDAGGGFGLGPADLLKREALLQEAFEDYQVLLSDFGGSPYDRDSYADLGTEMYAEAAESIKGLTILRPPEALEGDLCERRYTFVNISGHAVKKLEPKEQFRKRMQQQGLARSPDDGDGFVLACGPDYLFDEEIAIEIV